MNVNSSLSVTISVAIGLLILPLLVAHHAALAVDAPTDIAAEVTLEATLVDDSAQHTSLSERLADQHLSSDDETPGFILAGLIVRGLNAIGPTQLLPLYEAMLGERISEVELHSLATTIEAYYRTQGFPHARVLIPQQKIRSGIVHLTVFEGSISRIRLAGETEGVVDSLTPYLSYIPLHQTLDPERLEHLIQVLSSLPGIAASPSVELISGTTKEFELVIYIRRRSNTGLISVNNRGSKLLGPLRARASYTINNPFNTLSQIKLSHTAAPKHNELQYSTLNLRSALGARGMELDLSGAYGDIEPGDFLKALDPVIRIKQLEAKIHYPVSLGYHHGLSVYIGARYYEADVDILGAPVLVDTLYTLRSGMNYWNRDPGEYDNALQVDVVHGLQGLSDTLTVSDGVISSRDEEQFTLLQLNALHTRHLNELWQLQFEIDGQYSSRSLPSAELFSFGGATLGKAYDPGEIFGDHGIAGQLTLQRKGLSVPFINADAKVYTFYDIGQVWDEDSGAKTSAASAGIGSKIIKDDFSISFEISQPLTRPVFLEEHGKNPRLFVEASYGF
ncbi:MAG: ShlB/FhaC/HecB family hemolysin secretion/activation protein [Porticoccaceae bacterium]